VHRTEGALVFAGATLTAVGQQNFDKGEVLRAANRLLRHVISHHLGGKELKTRKVLADLHRRLN
jgi:recombinational DNA repair protein (RecF pathway)